MDEILLPAHIGERKTASRVVRSFPPQSSGDAHVMRVTLPLVNFLREAGFYEEPRAIVVEQSVRKLGSKHGR